MALKTHPMYRMWRNMRERCYFPDNKDYPGYGGRGIVCCPQWKSFEQFLSDMGDRPTKAHTIERIDVNGNYEPGNCKWATRGEQGKNRRNTLFLTIEGTVYKAADLAEQYGVHRNIIYERYTRGLPFHEIIHKGRIKWGGNRSPRVLKTHCAKGHEYTPDNIVNKGGGQRGCRLCHNANVLLRYYKRRAISAG